MKSYEFVMLLKAAVDEFNASSGDSGDGDRLAGTVTDLCDEFSPEDE